MKAVFADANYWIALLNPHDDLHAKAEAVSSALGRVRFVTSEMVFTEVLNYFAPRGPDLRSAAAALIDGLRKHPETNIVLQTSAQFRDAATLYAQRGYKAWSLTDCASFQIMEREQITDALTHDKDFGQAGFKPLLRD